MWGFQPRRMNQARTFFVTTIAHDRKPIFKSAVLAELFLKVLFSYRDAGKFHVHEFVLMPDHFHAILTPHALVSLEKSVQFITGGYSHRARKEADYSLEIWQRSFTEHRIRDSKDYSHHLQYIHENPVRRHLCARPEEFPYSSANPRFALDPPPEYLRG
jgi:putative transposase